MAVKELRGIDVSKYQNGTIDYNKAKRDGVDFAIIKIIQGVNAPNIEPSFEKHYTGFTKAGIPVTGVYVYSYAITESRAENDAKKVLSILNGRKVKVWLDVEDKRIDGKGEQLIKAMKAFQKIIENAGLEFGIYTGQAWYNKNIKPYAAQFPNVKYWIAAYGSDAEGIKVTGNVTRNKPTVNGTLEMWQHSSKGKVDGFSGPIDLNILYVVSSPAVVDHPETETSTTTTNASDKTTATSLYAPLKFAVSKLGVTTTPSTAKSCVKLGQAYLNQAVGTNLVLDGSRGPKTKAAERIFFILCYNLDNGSTFSSSISDTEFNTLTGKVSASRGSKKYMNTFLEVLCLTHGVNPKGVEVPGSYGNGLSAAINSIMGSIVNNVTGKHIRKILA